MVFTALGAAGAFSGGSLILPFLLQPGGRGSRVLRSQPSPHPGRGRRSGLDVRVRPHLLPLVGDEQSPLV